jgi:hypothetical protein
MALIFGHFALGADVFLSRSGGGAHGKTLYLPCSRLKVPEVNGRPASGFHAWQGEKPLVAGVSPRWQGNAAPDDKIDRLHAVKILICSDC